MLIMTGVSCAFLFVLIQVLGSSAQNLIVNTTQGAVKGFLNENGDYYAFYGLRYGETTAKENRFLAPKPAPPYPGLYDAIHKVDCLQPSINGPDVGIEDCLALDVFTKNETAGKPVLVWLEGEGYLSSRMTYSFRQLVMEDTVVVSLNYRVSIFGFLCLGVPGAPGNAGLKDVVLGLQWIKENIANFGGDPNNVVLLGHGSGAAIADLLTLSPLSQGLIHKVIALSGSALAPWAISYDPIGSAEIVAAKLAYSGKPLTDLAELLKTVQLDVLLHTLNVEFTNNTVLFAPCVEDSTLNSTFLHDAPVNILKSGNYSHVPYLAAYTDREGTIRANVLNDWRPKMEANLSQFIQADLEFGSEENRTNAVDSIRKFYFRNTTSIDVEDYLDFHGDTAVRISVIKGVQARAATSKAEVRLLEFAYRGSTNANWPYPAVPLNGVKHGGILEYLFDINMSEEGAKAMASLVKHFVTFARTGTPSSNAFPGQQWLPLKNEDLNYYYFGGAYNQPHIEELKKSPHTQRMEFWNDLYDRYYKAPSRVSSAPKFAAGVTLLFCIAILAIF